MKRLEEENNRLFIDAYGLADELTPDVPIEQITLTVNPAYRYGGKLTEEEQWTRFRQDTCEELVSYAIGCMMGRYSLDEPGLIYAHSGNEGFDPSRYPTFPADDDGIIPITDYPWFEDDAAHRFERFLSVAWPKEHLEANLEVRRREPEPEERRTTPRHDPPVPRQRLLQTAPLHLQEAPHLLALLPAASRRPSSAWSTCTATTKAPWPACARST